MIDLYSQQRRVRQMALPGYEEYFKMFEPWPETAVSTAVADCDCDECGPRARRKAHRSSHATSNLLQLDEDAQPLATALPSSSGTTDPVSAGTGRMLFENCAMDERVDLLPTVPIDAPAEAAGVRSIAIRSGGAEIDPHERFTRPSPEGIVLPAVPGQSKSSSTQETGGPGAPVHTLKRCRESTGVDISSGETSAALGDG